MSAKLQALIRVAIRETTQLRKRRIAKTEDFQGITIRIDRPEGYVQRGKDAKGETWERTYKTDYGYIPGTSGGDGDGLDVYLGPDHHAKLAYWVEQRKASGEFDEYKLMLGFVDRRSAKAMWSAHTPERFYGGIATTSIGVVKSLLGIEPVALGKALDSMVERLPKTNEPSRIEKAVSAARVLKAEERGELRYVMGVVLEPDIVDAQGDTYDAEAVRQAAWTYMTDYQNRGLQHQQLVNHAVKLVESYIAPVDMDIAGVAIKAGTWLMAQHVQDDELWERVKSGAFTGFSIGGVATKVDPDTGDVIPPPKSESRYQPE